MSGRRCCRGAALLSGRGRAARDPRASVTLWIIAFIAMARGVGGGCSRGGGAKFCAQGRGGVGWARAGSCATTIDGSKRAGAARGAPGHPRSGWPHLFGAALVGVGSAMASRVCRCGS
jgi:hypothetical protein